MLCLSPIRALKRRVANYLDDSSYPSSAVGFRSQSSKVNNQGRSQLVHIFCLLVPLPLPPRLLFQTKKGANPAPKHLLCGIGQVDALGLAIGLAGLDGLARLLDGAENGLVVQTGLGDDECFLLLERDFVRLDAYKTRKKSK